MSELRLGGNCSRCSDYPSACTLHMDEVALDPIKRCKRHRSVEWNAREARPDASEQSKDTLLGHDAASDGEGRWCRSSTGTCNLEPRLDHVCWCDCGSSDTTCNRSCDEIARLHRDESQWPELENELYLKVDHPLDDENGKSRTRVAA